jgi:5-hydroxyisourate hydrolase-like protein (transthyretin family)
MSAQPLPTGTGRLTTHVLDTARGKPAAGLVIELVRIEGIDHHLIKTVSTKVMAGSMLRCSQVPTSSRGSTSFGSMPGITSVRPETICRIRPSST